MPEHYQMPTEADVENAFVDGIARSMFERTAGQNADGKVETMPVGDLNPKP